MGAGAPDEEGREFIVGLFSVLDKAMSMADTIDTDAHINGNQSKNAIESMSKTIGKPLDEVRDMQAHMLYNLDADVVEMVGDLEGGQEALDSIRKHTEAVRNGNLGTAAPSDRAYESEYGVDTFVYSEIAGLEGGGEILGRMAERKDAEQMNKTVDANETTFPKGVAVMDVDEAQEAAVKKTARDAVEAFGEHIKEQRDRATYGVDSETVDALRAMDGGEEVLGRMAERKARDREESTSKKNFEVGDDHQQFADVQSQFKYGVDADIADMIRELDGGDELLWHMAEHKDAAREAIADKIGDKLPAVSYVRGTTVKPMLTASADGASAAIGDALDAVQAGVSNMFDAAADFASERTASAKDMLAGVKDVVAKTGDKAVDAGVEL